MNTDEVYVKKDVDGAVFVNIRNTDTGQYSSEQLIFENEHGVGARIAAYDNDHPSLGNKLLIANNRPNGSIQIETGDTSRIHIDELGHVGIGVLDATEQLQVAGTIHSTTGGFKFPDGSVQTTTASTADGDWQISGNDIYSNVLGNVGIGTPTPMAKLDVSGDLNVDGSITIPPITRHWSISAYAFQPITNYTQYRKAYGCVFIENGSPLEFKLYAPVHLPSGAEITKVSAWLHDNDMDSCIEVVLYRISASGEEYEITRFGTLPPFASGSVIEYTQDISYIVNNELFTYIVMAEYTDDSNLLRLYNVHIEYEITQPLP
jgi:hypothetical protein